MDSVHHDDRCEIAPEANRAAAPCARRAPCGSESVRRQTSFRRRRAAPHPLVGALGPTRARSADPRLRDEYRAAVVAALHRRAAHLWHRHGRLGPALVLALQVPGARALVRVQHGPRLQDHAVGVVVVHLRRLRPAELLRPGQLAHLRRRLG
eukprot:2030430-Prymnesium_polylepis.3